MNLQDYLADSFGLTCAQEMTLVMVLFWFAWIGVAILLPLLIAVYIMDTPK